MPIVIMRELRSGIGLHRRVYSMSPVEPGHVRDIVVRGAVHDAEIAMGEVGIVASDGEITVREIRAHDVDVRPRRIDM